MTISLSGEQAKPRERNAPIVFAFHDFAENDDQIGSLVARTLPTARVISLRNGIVGPDAAHLFRPIGDALRDMDDFAACIEGLASFVAATRRRYPGNDAYGVGYAEGATVLAGILVRQPHLFDRAVLLHPIVPWTPPDNAGLLGKPILVTGGQHDPACPLALTERLVDYFTAQKTDVRALYHRGGHEIAPAELNALRVFLEEPRRRV